MKTRFICNVSNARLLRNRIDKGEGFEAEYVVERVVCIQCDVMLLVYSNGENYAKYCSIKSNGGVKVESRFTTSQRYSRK